MRLEGGASGGEESTRQQQQVMVQGVMMSGSGYGNWLGFTLALGRVDLVEVVVVAAAEGRCPGHMSDTAGLGCQLTTNIYLVPVFAEPFRTEQLTIVKMFLLFFLKFFFFCF